MNFTVLNNIKHVTKLEYPARSKEVKSTETSAEPIVKTEQDTLRILVGMLGVLLPILLWLFVYIDTGHTKPISSISHYYYTKASSSFVITMSLLAVFLMIYKGAKPIDFYLSFSAGLCALMVVFFPTSNLADFCCDDKHEFAITFITKEEIHQTFHFICAGLFLGILACISIFRFTKNNSSERENDKYDSAIYMACGLIMILCMLMIFLGQQGIFMSEEQFDEYSLTFWFESFAVWAFGYSWLLKAEFFTKLRKFFTVSY